MKLFKTFLIFEIKRSWTWFNVVVLILFFLASMYVVNRGVQEYNQLKEKQEKFEEIEQKKVDKWNNYEQYGGYGFRLFFMPSPLSIFFSNTNLFTEATAQMDVSEKLNIYQSFKGQEVFKQQPGRYADFSGLILTLGSLLALFYGFDTLKDKEFLKFLARLDGNHQVYSCMYSSRLLLLLLYFLGDLAAALIVVRIRGINFDMHQWWMLIVFIGLIVLILAFFFTVGTVIGGMRFKYKIVLIIFIWLFFIYLCPVLISTIIETQSDNLPENYEMELTKLTQLMDYENEAAIKSIFLKEIFKEIYPVKASKDGPNVNMQATQIKTIEDLKKILSEEDKKLRKLKTLSSVLPNNQIQLVLDGFEIIALMNIIADFQKSINNNYKTAKTPINNQVFSHLFKTMMEKIMEDFEKKVFPQIQKKEKVLSQEMFDKIRIQEYLSCFSPSTFYLAVNNEISSRGYLGIMDFYRYAQKVREGFFKFYIPKKLSESLGKKEKPQSFFKSTDFSNVMKGKSQLPQTLWLGLLFTLSWYVFACRLSYRFYKNSLFPKLREEIIGIEKLQIALNPKETTIVLTSKQKTISNQLYSVLSGKNTGFTGKMLVTHISVSDEKLERDFIYICQADKIPPEISVGNFISFITASLKLTRDQLMELNAKLNLNRIRKMNFGDLEEKERAMVLLETALLKKSDIYMFHDFAKGMPADFVKALMGRLIRLKESGASILYITNDIFFGGKISDNVSVTPNDAALLTCI